MSFETLAEHMRDVWLGDLIEGSFGASPDRIRRWARLLLLRLAAVALVFGTPWALAFAPDTRMLWFGATGIVSVFSAWSSNRSCRTRSWAFLTYGLYVALACPLVAGLSRPTAALWMPLAATLLGIAACCGFLAHARQR